jgi:hypothetical protein
MSIKSGLSYVQLEKNDVSVKICINAVKSVQYVFKSDRN